MTHQKKGLSLLQRRIVAGRNCYKTPCRQAQIGNNSFLTRYNPTLLQSQKLVPTHKQPNHTNTTIMARHATTTTRTRTPFLARFRRTPRATHTTTTRRTHATHGTTTRAPVHHHQRKPGMVSKISGMLLRLKGTLTGRSGVKVRRNSNTRKFGAFR